MALLGLIAKLSLDTREYERGVDRAQKKTIDFGNNVEKDLTKKLNRAFGISGLLAVGYAYKRATFDAAKEISELASAQDLTIAQLIQIQHNASAAGQSFEQYKKSIEATHGSLKEFAETHLRLSSEAMNDEAAVMRLNRARSSWSKFWNIEGLKAALRKITADALDFWGDLAGGDSLGNMAKDIGRAPSGGPVRGRGGAGPPMLSFGIGMAQYAAQQAREASIPRNAFEISSRTYGTNLNALQQVGAFTAQTQQTVEIRTAVQVLKQIDGTLKVIQRSTERRIELAE